MLKVDDLEFERGRENSNILDWLGFTLNGLHEGIPQKIALLINTAVPQILHIGSTLTGDNNIMTDIKQRILMENRYSYGLKTIKFTIYKEANKMCSIYDSCNVCGYIWKWKLAPKKVRWKYAPNLLKNAIKKSLWSNYGKWYTEIKV
jgi:hypothetical protein